MKDVLTVKLPTFTDETVASMQNFLEIFMNEFENHYCCQLEHYYCRPTGTRNRTCHPDQDDPPF